MSRRIETIDALIKEMEALIGEQKMTPRERKDMKYVVGVAIVAIVTLLLYIAFTS